MEDTGRAARYPHVTRKLTQCCHDLWNPPDHSGAKSGCHSHLAPKPFAGFARAVAQTLDLDGKPDNDPADRVELTIGTRNPDTGMTGFKGQLDDVGVELLGKALEGLTNTNPDQDGNPGPAQPGGPPGSGIQRSPHPVPERR